MKPANVVHSLQRSTRRAILGLWAFTLVFWIVPGAAVAETPANAPPALHPVRIEDYADVISKPGNFGIRGEVIHDEIIPLVDQVVAETQSSVIDLDAALSNRSDLFPDRIHPNATGAALIARAVYHARTGKEAPVPAEAGK